MRHVTHLLLLTAAACGGPEGVDDGRIDLPGSAFPASGITSVTLNRSRLRTGPSSGDIFGISVSRSVRRTLP